MPVLRPLARALPLAALLLLLTATTALAAPAALPFPKGFGWGVATSAFQSEAGQGRNVDTRSDWYVWTHDPAEIAAHHVTADRIENGPGGYAKYKQDIDLAKDRLRANMYRFSIEWSRIFPRSTASVRTRGATVTLAQLRALDRLADQSAVRHYGALLAHVAARGMQPLVTINHFSLPTWLHDPIAARDALAKVGPDDPLPTGFKGGWLDARTVTEFRKYAAYLAWKYGRQVTLWNPLNEPMVVATQGYVNVPGVFGGYFPPGAYTFRGAITAVLNLVEANRAAYDQIHRWDRRAKVGLVQSMVAFTPADAGSSTDVTATDHADYIFNRLFLDAAVKGLRDTNADEVITPAERHPELAGKADFVGVNYYFRGRVRGTGTPLSKSIGVLDFLPTTSYRWALAPTAAPCPTTCSEFGSEIYPDGFGQVLRTAAAYKRPLYVTENGIADGNDDQRPQYLMDHLRVLQRQIAQNHLDVRGYVEWSPIDNFEWSAGYTPKFGLFSYDPATLERTPRPAGVKVFRKIARANRIPAKLQTQYPASP